MNYRYMNYRYTLGIATRSTYRFLVTTARAVVLLSIIGMLMFGVVAFTGAALAYGATLALGVF